MASGAVSGSIPTPIVWLVISTNRVIGANSLPFQRALEDVGKPRSSIDEPTKSALRPSARCIDKDSAAVDGAAPSDVGECVDTFLQRTGRIAAVQGDLGHQRV